MLDVANMRQGCVLDLPTMRPGGAGSCRTKSLIDETLDMRAVTAS